MHCGITGVITEPDGPIWPTIGLVIAVGLSVVGWVLLAALVSWWGALALLGITMLIWLLVELRHHRR